MFLFSRKKAPVVGIDISSTSVKVLELGKTGSGYRVEHFGVEPMPDNAVTEKVISDVDAVGDTIRKAIKKAGIKNKSCALAVAGSAVITKKIVMQGSLKDDEMEGQVGLEADQYIPYALEEVNLDYNVLGPAAGNPDMVDVLLAASRSENVEMRKAAAEAAGLEPKIVDVEPYCVENCFSQMTNLVPGGVAGKTVAIFDVGATMTNLEIMGDDGLIYTREQPFGGKQLTEEIMRRYGLSYEEAGLAKKEGGLPDDYVTDVLGPFKETMAQQIDRFLQFFYSASQQSSVDHILLAGGCAAIPGIEEPIESSLGISTSIANPFSQMSVAGRINRQALATNAPAFLIACGLAMREY